MTTKTTSPTLGRRVVVLGLICAISVLSVAYAALAGETMSYECPVRSSSSSSSAPQLGPPPEVCISRLPNIGETAIIEVTYTSEFSRNFTESFAPSIFNTGWTISSNFEIIDSGGLEYEPISYLGRDDIKHYRYMAYTPLDLGETKTYRIEVRAVDEGSTHIVGFGYFYAHANLSLYLDDEDTLPFVDYVTKYPGVYEESIRARSGERERTRAMTAEELKNADTTSDFIPTRAEFWEFFTTHFSTTPKPTIGSAVDFIDHAKAELSLNATDIRQLLVDAGYTDEAINAELTKRASTQSSRDHTPSPASFVLYGGAYSQSNLTN